MFLRNKKCRIYTACGVSQTPNVWYNLRGEKDGRIFSRRFEEEAVKKAGMVLLISLLMAEHEFSRNKHLMVIGKKEDIDRLLRKL